MDNLTHTLIGVMAGEGLAQTGFARHRRTVCVALVAVASNLPDIDLLYTYVGTERDKLTYMLDHRGHSHTVIGCLALAAALYFLAWLWMRRRGPLARQDHKLLAGSALLGTLLHLSMDALNSYGVHLFWPFDNRWFYGDSVFIVEPLYWAAAAPLMFVFRSIVSRVLLGLVLTAAVGLSVYSGIVPNVLCVALAALIAILLAIGWWTGARGAWISIAAMLAVTEMFILSGDTAARRAQRLAERRFPSLELLDHVLTPMPANPFCWDLLLLQRQGDRYVARHAMMALSPTLMSARQCPERTGAGQTAPLHKVVAPDKPGIRWLGEYRMQVPALKDSVRSNCVAARAMQFLRAPFITQFNGVEVIGDLRFDREPQLGFTELELGAAAGARCPKSAPWVPPREYLLR